MNKFVKRYGFITFLIIIGVTFLFFKHTSTESEINTNNFLSHKEEQKPVKSLESTEPIIKVDVKGEVKNPGVYSVENNLRVDDVIQLAGGMTENADPTSVNLAQKLIDEMVVHVYASELNDLGAISEDGSAPAQKKNNQVILNQATVEEVQSLNGIGPSKAEAIIQYREENGPFRSAEDLLNVSGIGEKTLENMIDDIRVP
ncbi:helix-hairpin-helix domain-containing protein [Halobacillus sp. BBL2006]|uniref:helix-hairpin-helix domain-containing protein n=1 Tax=Halobacillus sp. BBL2006 TaxID=1543706 RepID=UPI0005423AC0|nr:helix-hairpin-helix domain-containing protein [Halobacillus sp. BBL2006]KHE71686.1 hypothetical protein LD39_08445 [Halobacillus sp. BBL2006]